MILTVDPFRLHERAASPIDEARAVAQRMRAYASDQGNAQYLRKLIYEDSATIVALIPQIEATGDQAAIADVYQAASVCGNAGEVGGNIGMWPYMTIYADKLEAALDLLGGAPPPILMPPANVDRPFVSQAADTLHCTMGNWSNMSEEPHSYSYLWRMDGVVFGVPSEVSSLTVLADHVGHSFDCVLTATNAAGSAVSVSNAHTVVALP